MKVTVTETLRSRALAQVLLAFQMRVGGRVFYRDIAEAWRSETGLRHGDLRDSLDELEARGGLRFHDGEHGLLVELTPEGGRALDAPMATPSDLFRHMHAGWVLTRTRRRYRRAITSSASTGAPERRAADQGLRA
jgi:hypothetical protein